MESAGAASAIASLAVLGGKTIIAGHAYREKVKNVSEDTHHISSDLEAIVSILGTLQRALDDPAHQKVFNNIDGRNIFASVINELMTIFQRFSVLMSDYKNVENSLKETTKWGLVGETEAQAFTRTLATHKQTLTLTLQLTNYLALPSIDARLKQTETNTEQILLKLHDLSLEPNKDSVISQWIEEAASYACSTIEADDTENRLAEFSSDVGSIHSVEEAPDVLSAKARGKQPEYFPGDRTPVGNDEIVTPAVESNALEQSSMALPFESSLNGMSLHAPTDGLGIPGIEEALPPAPSNQAAAHALPYPLNGTSLDPARDADAIPLLALKSNPTPASKISSLTATVFIDEKRQTITSSGNPSVGSLSQASIAPVSAILTQGEEPGSSIFAIGSDISREENESRNSNKSPSPKIEGTEEGATDSKGKGKMSPTTARGQSKLLPRGEWWKGEEDPSSDTANDVTSTSSKQKGRAAPEIKPGQSKLLDEAGYRARDEPPQDTGWRNNDTTTENQQTLDIAKRLGMIFYEQNEFQAAEPYLAKAVAGYEKLHGRFDIRTLHCLSTLIWSRTHNGKIWDSEDLLVWAVEGGQDIGIIDPLNLEMLGFLRIKQGRLAEAEDLLERALPVFVETRGPTNESTVLTMRILADVYMQNGKVEKAAELYKQVLDTEDQGAASASTSVLGPFELAG